MTTSPFSRTYTGLRVQQKPNAPVMYLLSMDAASLLEWADVPNAKADYMAGYQRVYSVDRAAAITEFLTADQNNIIPGAVIVTIRDDALRTEAIGTAAEGVVRLNIKVKTAPFEESLRALSVQFANRLSGTELDSIGIAVSPAEDTADATEEDEASGIPESYLAVLTAELNAAVEDFSSLELHRQDAIRNYVTSVSKPGLIIDGQHRVFGAKDVSANPVYLPVVLLPNLSMAEQVFHFYVLNNKAKPLSPLELRRTISTSLTDKEIDELWTRFEGAGVDPESARLTYKLQSDPRSPFVGLIDFGLDGSGFLKENVIYQVVSKFVKMPRKYRSLYTDVPQWTSGELDDRLPIFFAFWSAIRERYLNAWNEAMEREEGQIFYKASMLVLQDFLLDYLVQVMNLNRTIGKASPFFDLEDLRSVVKVGLSDLPEKFFTTEWQVKQIDTSDGRKFLRAQLQEVIDSQGEKMGAKALFRKPRS